MRRKSSVPRPPWPSEYSDFEIVDQRGAGAAVVGQLLLQRLPFAAEIAGNRQARLDGREQLGLLLDHLREALLHQAVQHLVDLLPRYVRARGQFQRLELGVAEQHQVGPRFVSVQPKLLQPSPEPLKINLGQFFAHILFTLSKPEGKKCGKVRCFVYVNGPSDKTTNE